MTLLKRQFVVMAVLCCGTIWAAAVVKEPHIGYVYPAGGQQGTKVQVTVGGQVLRGAKEVYVSGQGVKASVIKYQGRLKALNQDQREELQRQLRELRQKKKPAMPGRGSGAARPKVPVQKDPNAPAQVETKPVQLPDHPLLRNLDKLSLEGLDYVSKEFVRPNLNQQNPQIAETVLIEIEISSDAAPGDREIRLMCGAGLSNPMCFVIGTLPEVREPEYNDPGVPVTTRVNIPSVINGQILPGEVDRFRFEGRQGQRLVIEAQARRLIPYLGDAVPGWFQAAMKLYDSSGKEVAYADDFRFDPDPVMYYEIQKQGDYVLEINDAIYRGREDFVYRISVSRQPFITRVFPLGAKSGTELYASIDGWNLAEQKIKLDAKSPGDSIRRIVLEQEGKCSNSILYAVDDLPECNETQDNNTPAQAQKVALPMIINGRVESPDDKDVFQFEGKKDQEVVVEVYARRLHSPLDSLVQLTDEAGKVLFLNDDYEDKESGLLTHYADSFLSVKLPKDGMYYVSLADSQHHGGDDYGYRLHIRPPHPDFSVYVSPSSLNVPAGRVIPISVRVFRKEGFQGDIKLALKDAPKGFILDGGRIPGGRDTVRMTLTAPRNFTKGPIVLQFEGHAEINGRQISRPAVACEDMMQAFAYRHLVATQDLMAAGGGRRRAAEAPRPLDYAPLRIPTGSSAKVHIQIPPILRQQKIQLALSEPPEGISLEETAIERGGMVFVLKTDSQKIQPDFFDNLIVEISTQIVPKEQDGGTAEKEIRWEHFGYLPAIPVEIIKS